MKFDMQDVRATHYRVCVPPLKFVDINPQTKEVTGVLAAPVRAGLGIVTSSLKNVSLIKPSDSESLVTDTTPNKLPGCWGILQRGEADIYLYANEMPIMGLENITQLNTSSQESGTYILAPYTTDESISTIALSPLSSFSSLSVETWSNAVVMGIIFFVIMCYLKLFVYKRPSGKDASNSTAKVDETLHGQSLVYQVVIHFMQQQNYDYSGDTVRFVSLLMSTFAFLFITLLSCMIKCDKVSTHDIQVYDTYEKILANKSVQPMWVKNLNDFAAYKRAAKGSQQAQLWQQSLAISRKFPDRYPLIEASAEVIFQRAKNARKKEAVFFLSRMFTNIYMGLMCTAQSTDNSMVKQYKDIRLKGRLDEQVTTSLYVMPASTHSVVTDKIQFILRRIAEGRLLNQPDFSHMVQTHIAKDFLGGKINYNEDYYRCLNFEKLPTGETETTPLSLVNATDIFRLWAYCCFGSFIILLLEHFYRQKNRGHSKAGRRHARRIRSI